MVIKGLSTSGAARIAAHLERTDTNERMEVLELRDVAAEDLRGALLEMEAVASACPRCQKPFYHASINTRADEHLTEAQRFHAIDQLEQALGLEGQPRVVVMHEKEGREHTHIVWSRIDIEHMRTISDSHNYRQHELTARALEKEFGHERVQGAHIERDGQPRPERTPSHEEMQQAARGHVSARDAKAQITELWQQTDSGQAFKAALEERDWLLARGDRRDFVAVDPFGGTHSLARRVEGAKAADIRERMADVDAARLPSVAEAREQQQERQAAREAERPVSGDASYVAADDRTSESSAPALVPDDQVIDNEIGPAGRGAELESGAAAEPDDGHVSLNEIGNTAERGLHVVGNVAGEAGEKLADFVSSLTDSFTGTPAPRKYTAAELARDPSARRENYAQASGERASNEAIDRIRLDMEAGRGLQPADVRNLTRDHLLQIKTHGDDYVRQMVADRDRDNERSAGLQRERERDR